MYEDNVALNAIITCFQCASGRCGRNENGMDFADCTNSSVDPDLLKKMSEKYLPAYCGNFTAKNRNCCYCGALINQAVVLYINTNEGLKPVCSQLCAGKFLSADSIF